ncbi:MAG TPA: type II toxin-antitoxin system VapC family toxin [Pyrinomonadaceae bacterium]|nr:type II toxin-antitoxin system VapC family toxin [Pyrinomonadaceae bacterium]
MISAIDTNVLVALWDRDDTLNSAAQAALDTAFARGKLVISGAVFAELSAFPRRTETFLNQFLRDTEIAVDWSMDESVWRTAAKSFQKYANRGRKQRTNQPRRILADFLIGAHALQKGHSLLTLDEGIYRAAFPKLHLVRV